MRFDAVVLVAVAVVRHPVLSMCVNCWEFEKRFFVWRLYERLRNDPNTFNKIRPESWIRNIYESASVTVREQSTGIPDFHMCKCVILLPLFATLLLTDEDPYVDVDVINLALIRLVKRETEVKTKRLRLKPSSLAICAFPAVSLNIYHWKLGRAMNHVSFLETDIRVDELSRTVLLK